MPSRWRQSRNLLCIRLDALGDLLMTTPALRALRESCPGRRITLLTSPSGAAIARMIPEVDGVWKYEAPWMKATAPRVDAAIERDMIERLRRAQFDGAVIFTVFSQNPLPAAMTCFLAEIPLRLGHCRENPYQLLTDWVAEIEPRETIRHEVERQLDLVATIGARTQNTRLSLAVPPAARDNVLRRLGELGLAGADRWLVLHPGGTAPSRRYPAELFAEAAALLTAEGFRIVLTGDPSEAPLASQVRQGNPAIHDLAGQLSLAELAALIEAAPLLLCGNTGPAHVAAALGTPVVDLYALTNPQHTPWQVPSRVLSHDVPCKYCFKSVCPAEHHQCLRGVSPGEVAAAVVDLWQEVSAGRGAERQSGGLACIR